MHRSRRTATLLAALPLALLAVAAPTPASATTVGTTQGCTPGYWKNHTSAWKETARVTIPSSTPLSTVNGAAGQTLFSATATTGYGSTTMLQALSFRGGSGVDGAEQILLRAAVASWLNSAHEGIAYPLRRHTKVTGTVPRVNSALLSQDRDTMLTLAAELDRLNTAGCPL